MRPRHHCVACSGGLEVKRISGTCASAQRPMPAPICQFALPLSDPAGTFSATVMQMPGGENCYLVNAVAAG